MCDAYNQTAPRAVNFEFPLSRLSEALHYLAALRLIEPVGLHLHATAQWASDTTEQVCAVAWTRATDEQWHAYCETFNQQCVSLATAQWCTAYAEAKTLDLPAAKDHAKCVGPKPWGFTPLYFIHPSQPRTIEG